MFCQSRAALASVVVFATLACSSSIPEISPLARAAREGDAMTIRAMVAAGHDPNGVDPGGNRWTPLLHAIHKAQRPAIDALLATGANVHRKSGGLSPLMMAVGSGQTDVVRRLLAAGAHPRTDGPGVLATAVRGGALTDIDNPLLGRCNADVVRALLDRDPTLRLPPNVQGHLSFMIARLNGCDEVTRMVKFS